jgi:hypothetical protein
MCDTLDVLFPIFTTVPQKTPNPLDVLFIIHASSSRTPKIRIRISKKNRQHNGQKKKDKRTNNDLQNIYIKLKIR